MSDRRERGSPTRPLGSGASLANVVDDLRFELGQRRARLLFEPDPPRVLIEHFELIRYVAQGGMGAVFEGRDTKLGRPVALKVCLAADSLVLRHEAQCLAKLAHPNVVVVHDVLDWRGHVVLVMEFVEGVTLHAWQCETSPGWRVLLDRYIDAGRGLAAAHAAGIEHGDFKPNNVLIDVEGRVRVADFGLARPVADVVDEDAFVMPNMGTKVYMPPERLQGKSEGPRSDVYSFCASVWESLYRVRPFPGKNTHALLDAMMSGPPEPGVALRGTPGAVRDVLAKGLSRDPSERQPDMDTVLAELRHAIETPERQRVWWRRAIGLVIVGALVGGTAMVSAAWVRSQAPEPELVPIAEPEHDPIAQTLGLAREAADRGLHDEAIQYLELARKRALVHGDSTSLRDVASQAEIIGEILAQRGAEKSSEVCWDIAGNIYIELEDEDGVSRISRARNK